MRKLNWLTIFVVVVMMALTAGAQSKFSGKCSQGKPEPNYMIEVPDKPGHVLMLAKVTCTWSSGELGGVALKEEVDVVTSDVSGKLSHDHGYGSGTATSGDKYFVRFDGTTTFEKNQPVTATCTWKFTGGTGKLNGLTGNGTCTGKFDATGAAVFDIQGTYQTAATKKK